MEIRTQTPPGCFSKGLMFSALLLAFWLPQGSLAALRIQMVPEQPQKDQDLLLSLHGVPGTVQDFIWYLGEEAYGGTRLFSYIPGLPRPQRDGVAMGQRDIVGFPNGSMLLRGAQPSDSGTYQVAVAVNPAWTLKAKAEVRVAGLSGRWLADGSSDCFSRGPGFGSQHPQDGSPLSRAPVSGHPLPPLASASTRHAHDARHFSATGHLPLNAGIMAATIIGSLVMGSLLVSGVAYLLVTRSRKDRRSLRNPATQKPEMNTSPESGDSNIYEVMPCPVYLMSPVGDTGPVNPAMSQPPPASQENQHYQDLLNPDPAPYCQLVPTS